MITQATISQNPLNFMGKIAIYPTSIFAGENSKQPNLQNDTQIGKAVEFVPQFITEAKSYVIPTYTPLAYSLLTNDYSLETIAVSKLEKIVEVTKIYLDDQEQIADIKVFINMNTYDYDLIDKIQNEVEFPIKDLFKNKLIDIEYLPSIEDDSAFEDTRWKLIFNRNINNLVFDQDIYGYENPLTNLPLVNVNYL